MKEEWKKLESESIEERHQALGVLFGDEYYKRISESRINQSHSSLTYPLYVLDEHRIREPRLYEVFMKSAEEVFQEHAKEDLIKQGVPTNQAEQRASVVGRTFGTFARALYENNLGVGRAED